MDTSRTIPAAEFKARCLALMDEVAVSGQALTITKYGRPVAQLAPLPSAAQVRPILYGMHKGLIGPIGAFDPAEPCLDDDAWTADAGNL